MPLNAALTSLPADGTLDSLRRVRHGDSYAIPVFSFGDPKSAVAATLSINPSHQEFLTRDGKALPLRLQRFRAPWLPPSNEPYKTVASIQADCNDYFKRTLNNGQRTFYKRWFSTMEALLNLSSRHLSYLDGTACHLDLSPWASDPAWGKLLAAEQEAHLAIGIPVLLHQLGFVRGSAAATRRSSINMLLLNGTTTARQVLAALGTPAVRHQESSTLRSSKGRTCTLEVTTGSILGIEFVAWNIPLARPFGRLAMPRIAKYF